jgi:Tol biopolymer transport system component
LWVASGLAYSRDGKTLALVGGVQEEAPRAVWLLPVAGGTPRKVWDLARGAAEQAAISWMPDGRHMLVSFRTPGVSGDRLMKLDISTGKTAPIAPGIGLERWPAVSPDGTKIAFTAGQIDYDLVEIPLDGGHAKTLLATSFHEADPEWSNDGAQLVLSRNAAGWGQEVWLFNPQGGTSRQLTGTAADSIGERMRPRLSPDGGRVAYEQFAAGHTIWISTIAGGQPVRLEEESNDQHVAAWSPDGAWIAYRRQLKGSWEIAKAPSGGGGKPVRLAPTKLVGPASGVVWSRDGRWIGFGDVDGIRLISPEGTDLRLLYPMKTPIFDFSGDNRTMLALARDPEGWWELHELDLKTGADKHLGRVDLPRYCPLLGFSLHPDGKRFATGAGTSREDIWILEGVSP